VHNTAHENGRFFYGKNTKGLPMSLFRTLTEAALAANLNQNESKVFIALVNQTIGYGKAFDHLTDKRLAQLTNVRLDRLYVAIEGVVEKDLFDVEESNYYDYRYQISEKFLDKHPIFYTPHLPKKEIDFRQSETISYFRNDPLKIGHIPNNTFTSFNLTTTQPQQPPQLAVAEEKQAVSSPSTETHVVVGDKIKDQDKITDKVNVDLPEMIEERHYPTCQKALYRLTFSQQKRVLKTFEMKEESEGIYNPVGLLISLSQAEEEGRLIVPKTPAKPPKTTYHPSHKPFETTEKSSHHDDENKDNGVLDDHVGKLNWLKDHALSQNQSMPDFADSMGMSIYLENKPFVQGWLTFQAQQKQQSVDKLAKELGLRC
jgi:phage replication O-like protein O